MVQFQAPSSNWGRHLERENLLASLGQLCWRWPPPRSLGSSRRQSYKHPHPTPPKVLFPACSPDSPFHSDLLSPVPHALLPVSVCKHWPRLYMGLESFYTHCQVQRPNDSLESRTQPSAVHKVLNLIIIPFIDSWHYSCVTGVWFRKSLPIPASSRILRFLVQQIRTSVFIHRSHYVLQTCTKIKIQKMTWHWSQAA